MEKPDEITPDFNIPADEMLLESQTMIDFFIEDQKLFTDKVPDLQSPFETDWQNAINDARQAIKDDDYLDVQQGMTNEIETLMAEACNRLQTLYFYVDRAFPGNKVVNEIFGHDRYEKARKSPLSMFDLLIKAYNAANDSKYKSKLIEKGLKPDGIETLKTTSDTLYSKYQKRDKYISDRGSITQNRTILLNKVWAFNASVSDASKLVFQENYAKMQQYLLYGGKKQSGEETKNTIPEQNQ
ncbi:MAG: hypothetical protein M0R21_00215 [Lentimicrobiaceae bacterium]|jgi:DnaJ-domain-containing protein 1|nr:hypothetical protein [Lentimicrobiaceae bacterium]